MRLCGSPKRTQFSRDRLIESNSAKFEAVSSATIRNCRSRSAQNGLQQTRFLDIQIARFYAPYFASLAPRRTGRPLDFTLPAVNDVHDVVTAMAAITTGVNDGSLTAEEAGQLMHILNGYTKALETHDLATRIAALESQLKTRP
jgi:hypothetical protein